MEKEGRSANGTEWEVRRQVWKISEDHPLTLLALDLHVIQ